LQVDVQVVSFARIGVDVILIILVVASGSNEHVGFRVHCGGCSYTAGVIEGQLGLCALLLGPQKRV